MVCTGGSRGPFLGFLVVWRWRCLFPLCVCGVSMSFSVAGLLISLPPPLRCEALMLGVGVNT